MLKGISPVISPELLKILCEMGHGDEIVIGDGNFPAAANAQRLVRLRTDVRARKLRLVVDGADAKTRIFAFEAK